MNNTSFQKLNRNRYIPGTFDFLGCLQILKSKINNCWNDFCKQSQLLLLSVCKEISKEVSNQDKYLIDNQRR